MCVCVCVLCVCLRSYPCALKCPWRDICLTIFLFLFSYQSSYPVWEDFSAKATKLHSQLRWEVFPVNSETWMLKVFKQYIQTCMCHFIFRTTILAAVAFLDAFQKVADLATNSRGKWEDSSINTSSHTGKTERSGEKKSQIQDNNGRSNMLQ